MKNSSPRIRTLRALREQLNKGLWKAGERLPTEMQISEDMGVSRPTVRAALAVLESEGLILSKGRAGRVVSGGDAPLQACSTGLMSGTVCVLSGGSEDVSESYSGGGVDAVESGIVHGVMAAGRNVLRIHEEQVSQKTAAWLRVNRPAGIVLTPEATENPSMRSLARDLKDSGIPVVAGGRSEALPDCDLVTFDHEGGAAALTRWLLGRGCRRILPFWSTRTKLSWISEREAGYCKAMREAGLEPMVPVSCEFPMRPKERNDEVLETRIRMCLGYLFEFLTGRDKVDAVMLLEDSTIYPFIGACRIAGVKTGAGGLLYTGFDNFWAECWEKEIYPPCGFATVDKKSRAAGDELAAMLLCRMAHPQAPRNVKRMGFEICEYA